MSETKAGKPEWTNDVKGPPPAPHDGVDRQMQERTPDEERLYQLAEENKKVRPTKYDITSKNQKAPRVVHDFYGDKVMIHPGETVRNIELHPNVVAVFSGPKSDLALTPSAA